METFKINGAEYRYCKETPLTKDEIKEMAKSSMDISVVVRLNFGDCLDNGWEWFWDALSKGVTGSSIGFQDLQYEIVGAEDNDALFLVTGLLNLEDLGIEEEDE